MGWTVGILSMKLSNSNRKSKHCGNFYLVAAEALSERVGRDPDINPELSYKNIYMVFIQQPSCWNTQTIIATH